MASEPDPEPDFQNVAGFGFANKGDGVIEHLYEFEKAIQSENLDAEVILGDTNIKVPGRIKGKLDAYLEANASEYVLNTIAEGYKLIFIDDVPPPPSYLPNNKSALCQRTFLHSELVRLEQLGCIRKVFSRPHVVNPCSVVYSKKLRCVLDASQWLNKFCVRRKTVLADLSRIPYLVRKGDYMTVNDLDSGYWQVPIFPPHQKYLGLSFENDDLSMTYWVWVVMPLGIVDAAHIFTALTDPLMDCILLKGMRANIYIDDLLSVCQGFVNAVNQDKAVQAFFYEGGWVFKPSKSSGPPSQRVTYLGLVINSLDMIFEIPADKMLRLLEGAKVLLSARRFLVKTLASWVGLLQSVRLALGPVVSIMCRSLYDSIKPASP